MRAVEERLQKIISGAGLVSRRKAEQYITEGRVTVNGTVAQLGEKADPERDEIYLDGQLVKLQTEFCYLMLHKPRGYVTTMEDEHGRKTAADLVQDCGVRVYPVGRLDLNSEGLLLFTNDGDLTHRLLHPSHQVEKEYHVRVRGDLRRGVPILSAMRALDGEPIAPAQIQVLRQDKGQGLISVTIHEGKNRQVRRMCAAAGLDVLRLRRVREDALYLGNLPVGQWRYLTPQEINHLKKIY